MSSLCQIMGSIRNFEICILSVHSVTISNDSAFYFIEIIVFVSWISTQTHIPFQGRGPMRGSSLCQNPEIVYANFIQLLFSVTQPHIS